MADQAEIGRLEKMKIFFGQVQTEMQKVSWPSREDVKTYTIVTLVSAVIVTIVVGVFDTGLTFLLTQVLRIGASS